MTHVELSFVALNCLLLDPSKSNALCRRYGGPHKLLALPRRELGDLLPASASEAVSQSWQLARQEIARAGSLGIEILTPEHASFPEELRQLSEPDPGCVPPAIYAWGDLRATTLPTVAIVGSRRATPYGEEVATHLARDLARRGVSVVSGMARGIDGAAHRGALEAGGVTVAVLGSGMAAPYPRENAPLMRRIAESGLVLSEFPLDTPPLARNFPRRNRIIAALADVIVVVEATETSGSRHTADAAILLGKSVMAVPGPITAPTSRGCNALLRDGAQVVTCADDITQAVLLSRRFAGRPGAPTLTDPSRRAAAVLPGDSQGIESCLSVETPRHVEEIVSASGKSIAEVLAELQDLVLRGVARQLPGQLFQRVMP